MKSSIFILVMASGSLLADEPEVKPKYAFEDSWNFRIEQSGEKFMFRKQKSKSENPREIFADLSGHRNLVDINYGPIGLFAAQSSASGTFRSRTGYSLSQKIKQDEAGLFLEMKPFLGRSSHELRGLSFGLRVSMLSGTFSGELSDEFQKYEMEQKYRGAKCGIVVRFYTIADFYFSLGTDFTAIELKIEDLSVDTVNLYQNFTYGVGYAF